VSPERRRKLAKLDERVGFGLGHQCSAWRKRSASSAAMQPVPAAVTAWR
jgi:hypothetical protein